MMNIMRTILLSFVVLGVTAVLSTRANAGGPCCECCGCQHHVKRVCKLVIACEQVPIPKYECKPMDVFCPDKGVVCHTGYRCDKTYNIETHWACKESCSGCDSGEKVYVPSMCCTCETHGGCKTLLGAKPTGCMSSQCVETPAGKCTPTIPIAKWIVVHVCQDCCKAGKTGH